MAEITRIRFAPIALGEVDWRAFDFTRACDGEAAAGTEWTVEFVEDQVGDDPAPGDRLVSAEAVTELTVFDGPGASPVTKTGVFSVGHLTFAAAPAGAAGYYYRLTATLTTAGGRVLSLSGTILCSAR